MENKKELWISTSNLGKLREYERLFSDLPFELRTIKDMPTFYPPPEDGKTFLDNARIKAKSIKAVRSSDWVIGEDSGLELPGLNGLPGIHSARYAGPNASDLENTTKLLKMLEIRGIADRSARFVCTMVVFDPEVAEYVFTSELKGEICRTLKGTGGFGYDPTFIPTGHDKTLAELEPIVKNKISHRAHAVQKMLEALGPRLLS